MSPPAERDTGNVKKEILTFVWDIGSQSIAPHIMVMLSYHIHDINIFSYFCIVV